MMNSRYSAHEQHIAFYVFYSPRKIMNKSCMHEASINSHLHVNVYFRHLVYTRQLNQVTDMHLGSGGFGVKWRSSTAGPPVGK